MTAVAEGPANFAAASPQTYAARPGAQEAWLIHGVMDETVSFEQSEAMRDALRNTGFAAELILYPEAGHSDFLFGALGDEDAQVIRDMGRIVRED
jgi:dipeptidyl aminopeptidase/acylaminoacyl peptidase